MKLGDMKKISDFPPIQCARCGCPVEKWEAYGDGTVPAGRVRFVVFCHGQKEESIFDPAGLGPNAEIVEAIAFRTPREQAQAEQDAELWAPFQVRVAQVKESLRQRREWDFMDALRSGPRYGEF